LVPRPVADLLRSPGPGEPIPSHVAEPIAHTLGVDVRSVRVHGEDKARAATALLHARAFAWGRHVFLGPGERAADLPLMAHEVAHVVQQQGTGGPAVRLFTTDGPEPYEREAGRVAAAATRGERAPVGGRTAGPRIQRLFDWAKKGIAAVGRGISAVASAVAELGEGAINAALNFVKDKAKSIPGYDLLAFVLGRDVITQEPVERNAVNLVRALLGLIPGGAAIFDNLQKTGVIQRAYDWTVAEIGKLGLTWPAIRALFQQAWDALGVADLLSPSAAWEKLKRIFGPPLGRLADFAIAAGKKILEFVFEGAMALGGSGAQYVLGLFRRAQAVIGLIVGDPVKFFGNLVKAAKGGFEKFASRIVDHLKAAIFSWLFGALKGALTLPAKFDLAGIVDIVLQVLGLTWERFREKLVKLIGPTAVTFLETAFDFLKTLVTKGIAAAWEKLLEFASGLVDTVIGAIRDWVAKSIVGAAITKLVTMFNPLGALIQAVIGIYNTIMFFVEKAKEIAEFIEAIVASLENIATGKLQQAIDYVEKTLARMLVVLIGFLARFVGLGRVADYVKDVIKKIQATVDKAVDKVLNWIVDKAKSLLGRANPTAPGAAAPIPETPFEGGHRIFFKQEGDHEVAMVQSEPKTLAAFLDEIAKEDLNDRKKEALKEARRIAKEIEPLATRLLKADPAKGTPSVEKDRKKVLDLEAELAPHLKTLLAGVPLGEFNEIYTLEGVTGPYSQMPTQKRDKMTPDHQPQAAVLVYAATKVLSGPSSKVPLFDGKRLQTVAGGAHAQGAWTINLHHKRHVKGRTYGRSIDSDAKSRLDDVSKDGKSTPESKRTTVVGVLRDELKADVEKMLQVVGAKDDDAAWEDIRGLGLGKGTATFIDKVRAQIKAGEARMRTQDLSGLKS
jgi:hypothetical protein